MNCCDIMCSVGRANKARHNEEEYRSGHNGAVLKTVRAQAHGGSNPSSSAKLDLDCAVSRNPNPKKIK